ncbi:MAG: hypothetical protein LBG19_08690 [Prevotellaceae bacterium]|jgi:tRNA-binding EMAP/Myf-like protein|nr:hypothetical protein [Prevotellaceae bacterium]
MKQLLTFFVCLSFCAVAQDKYNHIHFDKLVAVEGSDCVIATIENRGKVENTKELYLLFINTVKGEVTQVEFLNDAYIRKIEQVKVDELGINKVIVEAKTVSPKEGKAIGWDSPTRLIVLSPDGKEAIQLTDSKLFVRTWVVNKQSGTVVITGHYDTNGNGKYDKTDKNEILIYSLKTLRLISKVE